jgi:molecular chaperone DnaJ
VFSRDGANVLADIQVPLHIALLGGVVRVPTVDGDVDLTIPPGTQPYEKKLLKNRGVSKINRKNTKGDQILTLKVNVPKGLTKNQKALLEEAFGISKIY